MAGGHVWPPHIPARHRGVFTPRNTLVDKPTPSTAYLAVNACYELSSTNDACHGSPREHHGRRAVRSRRARLGAFAEPSGSGAQLSIDVHASAVPRADPPGTKQSPNPAAAASAPSGSDGRSASPGGKRTKANV
eukprot:5348276-Pleurochrysis_carterae.AAC.1